MMFLLILLSISISCELYDAQSVIEMIENDPSLHWEARENHFSSWTVEEIKSYLNCPTGDNLPIYNIPKKIHTTEINQTFDSREKWPHCVHFIQDQGQCGSCWAFGVSETVSDRFCIASNGTQDAFLSAQDLVSCDYDNFGCRGGVPLLAWEYVRNHGIVSRECLWYESGHTKERGICPFSCHDEHKIKWFEDKHHIEEFTHIGKEGEEAIMSEIAENGPVMSSFDVYYSFMSYHKGVYKHKDGEGVMGGHSIKIVGYGVSDDTGEKYWIVANSWGASWGGLKGYFWILRGTNECKIEQQVFKATPKLK